MVYNFVSERYTKIDNVQGVYTSNIRNIMKVKPTLVSAPSVDIFISSLYYILKLLEYCE